MWEPTRANRPPCIWDALTGRKLLTLNEARLPEAHPATFSPDGMRLVTPARENTACIWDTLSGQPLKSLEGHTGRVVYAAFSRDGKQVATVGEDQTVRIWVAKTGAAIRTITWPTETHEQPWSVRFSPDGKRLLACFFNWGPQIWDITTGRRLNPGRLPGQDAVFTASGDQVICFHMGDQVAVVSDIATGKRLVTLQGHLAPINAIAPSPDGQTVLTTSGDRTIRLWDVVTGAALATLRGHKGGVSGATFSPDGTQVVSASTDRTVRIWNVKAGRDQFTLTRNGMTRPHASASYDPQGTRALVVTSQTPRSEIWDIATGDKLLDVPGYCRSPAAGCDVLIAAVGEQAAIWDRASGKQLASFTRRGANFCDAQLSADGEVAVVTDFVGPAYLWHWKADRHFALGGQQRKVYDTTFSADSKIAVTGTLDGHVDLWNVDNGERLQEFVFADAVWRTRLSADGRRLLVLTGRNTAHLCDVETGRELRSISPSGQRINEGHFSADGKRLVTYHRVYNDSVRVWDAQSGELVDVLADMPGQTTAVFDPSGQHVAVTSMTKGLILWDLASQQQQVLAETPFRSAVFSDDGKWLAAATSVPPGDPSAASGKSQDLDEEPPSLFLWDTATWKLVHSVPLPGRDPFHLAFLAGAKQLFVNVQRYGASIFDQQTGAQIAQIKGHAAPVIYARFSLDGQQVLTASWDGTASLWDAQTGQLIRTFTGHRGGVLAAASTAPHVATASADGTCRIWNRQTGQLVATLSGHDDQVDFVTFTPDGQRVLTLSRDRSMRLWALDGRELDRKQLAQRRFISAQYEPHAAGLLVVPGCDPDQHEPVGASAEQPGFNVRIYRNLAGDRFGDVFRALPHAHPVIMASFAPDGKRVITVDETGAAFIWDAHTGEKTRTFHRDDQQIDAAFFDPTGTRILLLNDNYMSLMDSRTGLELLTLRDVQPPITTASAWTAPHSRQWFSSDGEWIVTVNMRGRVRQWPLRPSRIASHYLPRSLTRDEIENFEIRDAQ